MFTGAFIYADDITLLAPTRQSMIHMLNTCEKYALTNDIIFNPCKTKYMLFNKIKQPTAPITFMNETVECVKNCTLLGIHITNDHLERNINATIQNFYSRCNEILLDFSTISSHIKSNLIRTYCLDAYGSNLWNFGSNYVDRFYVAWRKVTRRVWSLPYTTHCNLLHVINDTNPIDVLMEKRCIKFIWSCLHSSNAIVHTLAHSALINNKSTFGENYRYFNYKYKILPHMWHNESICNLTRCINIYVKNITNVYNSGTMVRELCFARDGPGDFVLTATEISFLVEYLCTI